MKKRNSLAILCVSAFCFSLALAGCNSKTEPASTVDPDSTFVVTFDSRGGSAVEAQTVKSGECAVKPANPTKENYTFVQWCEDEVGVTPFDFSTKITSNWTLYASWKSGEETPPVPPQPETGDYYALIGSNKVAMTSNSELIAENQVANYVCTFAALTQGETVHFLDSEEQTIVNVGPDADYEDYHNNIDGTFEDGYTIHSSATNAKVSLRVWEDGYSFWIDGYSTGGGDVPADKVRYYITSMPDWITADGCVIYAWIWGTGNEGSWKAATFDSSTTCYFDADAALDGFLLARCVAGTTEPDWSKTTGDEAGRIYNKTEDITCTAGTYSYSCSSWVDYPESSGGGGGTVIVEGDYTYNVENLPTWITNDGCVIFAWCWSANDTGSWHATTYTDTTTLKFYATEELNGFLLARCIAGTTCPDWSIKTDEAGRVYNKTSDITCSSGTYTYSAPESMWTAA